MTNSSNEKLSPNAAQRLMLNLLEKGRAQVDRAARAPLARDRAKALRRLQRATELLSDAKKI